MSTVRAATLAGLLLACALALAGVGAAATGGAPGAAGASAAAQIAYATATATSPPAVWVAQADGRGQRRLGAGDEPLLAPDGQSVAASVFGNGGDSEHGPALALYSA